MKLIYCTHSVVNPGGMERVLLNKVSYLRSHTDWELLVVTTDQKGRAPFYPFPEGVRMVDLNINYSDDNVLSPWGKIQGYLRRRKLHRQRLTELLMKERADIVVSLYPSESSFLPEIKDGSRKVLELHFNKFFRLQYNRRGVLGWIDRFRTWQDEHIVRRFDKFVVLTEEDRAYWGNLQNIEVIPNAAIFLGGTYSDVSSKRIIVVGRLDYQKGFDRLIQAWELVQQEGIARDWHLDIFGQGEWQEMLQCMIDEKGLGKTVRLNRPTTEIGKEYAHSSMLVMSSHYEGFPMVMIEAMAYGLPVVSFDYKCGPKDIIIPGTNGILVKDGDIGALADAMKCLMADDGIRKKMSEKAREVVETYSEERVMGLWLKLFEELVPGCTSRKRV